MEVIWTKIALLSLKSIYIYYKENVNVEIAEKIKITILSVTSQLKTHHLSGKTEELLSELSSNHRFIIIGNYKVIYKVVDKKVYITDIFDTRQNPVKIIKRSK